MNYPILDKNNHSKRIYACLCDQDMLDPVYLHKIIKNAKKGQHLAEEIFMAVDKDKHGRLLAILSEALRLPAISLRDHVLSGAVLGSVPREIAEELRLVPFGRVKDTVYAATTRPENPKIANFFWKSLGCAVKLYLSTPDDIEYGLSKYAPNREHGSQARDETPRPEPAAVPATEATGDLSAIGLVNGLIESGLDQGASDIHIEPGRGEIAVRYRVDGILRQVRTMPKALLPPVIARIRILSNAKIDEQISPQDGRFRFSRYGREIAVRVSIIPTLNGPKAVLRLLDPSKQLGGLEALGLNRIHQALLEKEISSPQGMILVTGPTGSGKTTTLYTILARLNSEQINICTIEDPIEYNLDRVSQMQVNPRFGLTFAQGLRALLRQDPNVIMVGEIRDAETGEIAMSAAMTGHLVLSTMHTNSAFAAPQRLIEMKVEPYLVSAVSNLVVGQRLVRRLCPHCKAPSGYPLLGVGIGPAVEKALHKLEAMKLRARSEAAFYEPKGCARCDFTGYRGRIGIYEMIALDKDLKNMLLKNGSEGALRAWADKEALTMAEDGILKAAAGLTSLPEVIRVTR